VLTPLIERQIEIVAEKEKITRDEAAKRLVSAKQPSEQFSKPEDIGEMVVFLVSDNAKQVNGAAWTIDGCWTAQ
jgi:3-hydroxybutyrate dehydrogenase